MEGNATLLLSFSSTVPKSEPKPAPTVRTRHDTRTYRAFEGRFTLSSFRSTGIIWGASFSTLFFIQYPPLPPL